MQVVVSLSCLTLATPWTVAHQAPLSMGFSRQEYRGGLPCLPPGDLPNSGIEPRSLGLVVRFFTVYQSCPQFLHFMPLFQSVPSLKTETLKIHLCPVHLSHALFLWTLTSPPNNHDETPRGVCTVGTSYCSVVQSLSRVWVFANPMDCSTAGLPGDVRCLFQERFCVEPWVE